MWGIVRWIAGVWITSAIAALAFIAGYVYLADLLYRRALVRAFRDELASIPETR